MRVINPATDELLRELAEDDSDTIRGKLVRARAGQRDWARRPFSERARILGRFGEIVAQRREELARTLTLEVGKPITQSRRELDGLQARLAFFLEHTERELAEQRVASAEQGGTEEIVRLEPLGVVANVSAWNYPYFVGSNVFLPALLTGSSVLYKPSEHASLTGLEIERALGEAGVPRDVFQTLIGGGAAGAELVEQPVDGVFFTGSLATGRRIAAAVAPRMIPLGLELGGKDPAYVADNVDVAAAAAAVADGAFYNAGQSCCAVERVYVQERIWQPFVDAFVGAVRGFALGDPLDEATYVGALARRDAQLSLLTEQVEDAVARGARLLAGGRRALRAGWFFEPTVLADVDHSMRVMREESFGPIIGLMKVASDERALELMADTEYGLTAAVYARDRARAERILSELDVGSAYWNCCDRVSPRLPWSGRHCSGIGCTLGTAGIRAFLKPKAWHLRPA
jgi:acyl-CoA reductase-like NAD-dependent aldehyde dehydrogenase